MKLPEFLAQVKAKYRPLATVRCDEAHPHTAIGGCVSTPHPDQLVILQLLDLLEKALGLLQCPAAAAEEMCKTDVQ